MTTVNINPGIHKLLVDKIRELFNKNIKISIGEITERLIKENIDNIEIGTK